MCYTLIKHRFSTYQCALWDPSIIWQRINRHDQSAKFRISKDKQILRTKGGEINNNSNINNFIIVLKGSNWEEKSPLLIMDT